MDGWQEADSLVSRMWVPIAVFFGGLTCIAAAVATGEAEVDLVLIFPVFSGSSGLFLAGTALIIISFLAGFVMVATSRAEEDVELVGPRTHQETRSEKETHFGGVVLIGPFPIAFGSDKRTAFIMLVLGIAMAVALVSAALMLG